MTAPKARILVIDDEPIICRCCLRILEAEGYSVEATTVPAEGLEKVSRSAEGGFDVVITDLKMPAIDGLEVLRRVKVTAPGCRVIVITGYATATTGAEALRAGAFDYLPKPFTPDELLAAVSRALAGG